MKKSAKKTVVKKPAPQKPAAKPAVKKPAVKKPAAKTAVKTAVKKTAAKKPAAAAPKKPAPVKSAPVKKSPFKSADKPVAKKAAAKKAVVKKVVKKTGTARTKPASAPASVAAAPVNPVNLKGLKISGNKAARIAQIVAESFLNKPAAAEPAPAPVATSSDDAGLTAAHKAAAVLFAKKAEDVVLMDLRNLSTVADYYLIATCSNEPQMRSILSTVQRSLSREGIKSLRSEYMSGVRWAVVDYGDMILHLFEKQTRGFYSLERLWADAPSTVLKASDYALPASDDGEESDDDGDL